MKRDGTLAMIVHKHVVRDVFLAVVSIAGIVLVLSAFLDNSNIRTAPVDKFLPETVSNAVHRFVSDKPPNKMKKSAEAPAPPPPDELDRVLAKTAKNGTVIITTLNKAWAEPNTMIDLFLESFRIGEGTRELLDNVLIVGLDAKAYNRCLEIHRYCYSLKTKGVDFSAEKLYMTDDYLKMMWTRLGFLGDVLRRGYNMVFTDTDIMWLRNPMKKLAADADIQCTSDRYNGDPFDITNEANTGFMYVRSNNRTINFYRYWYLSRRFYPGRKEQDVLNELKFSNGFSRRGMTFMFLDTKYFGGFCEMSPFLDDVYTMHANCCRGQKAKLVDLRQTLEDWSNYRNGTTPTITEWRTPQACRGSWFT
uniref:Nucleotide-diphospho-sugar transferase domain-containing protein n=1 Tax=Araucaria cunninghamii TaxID=56994 RepID=A0A0D6R7L8_ARACU